MERLIQLVSDMTGVSIEDIKSRKRTGDVCEARQIFIYLSINTYRYPSSLLASYLGKRTKQAILLQFRCLNRQMEVYKGLSSRVKEIESMVI